MRLRRSSLIDVFILAIACCIHVAPLRSMETPALSGGAASVEDLVDRLLQAIAANDEKALHALRVSEVEYRTVIVPGTVEVGEVPRRVDDTSTDLFWRMLDTKSRDFSRALLAENGGKKLVRKEVRFSKGVHRYGGYTAHGQVRVLVADAEGTERVIRSGTIAQVGERYKLISLSWDD